MVEAAQLEETEIHDLSEPTLLTENIEIQFNQHHDRPTVFFFEADSSARIILEAWEVADIFSAKVDMFVTVNDENVSADNYRFKGEYGVGTLSISPNNDNFKPGLFRLAFIP